MNGKQEFIDLLQSTGREGVDHIIEDLKELGFFEAPASSRFHLNVKGGLVQHSLNVCKAALMVREAMIELDDTLRDSLPQSSVIIASLLHDACKADIYKPTIKKDKNQFGIWIPVEGYDVVYDNFPLGHGEKSVIMLLRGGMDLTDDEIMAISWHMHAWDLPFQSPDSKDNFNAAKSKCPLLTLIQAADGLASGLLENKVM